MAFFEGFRFPLCFHCYGNSCSFYSSSEIPQDDLFYQPQSTAKAVYIEYYLETPRAASPTMLNLTILSPKECKRKLEENGWEKSYTSLDLTFCAGRVFHSELGIFLLQYDNLYV
jgi:hypothetical protein